jgi:hypothetical protein
MLKLEKRYRKKGVTFTLYSFHDPKIKTVIDSLFVGKCCGFISPPTPVLWQHKIVADVQLEREHVYLVFRYPNDANSMNLILDRKPLEDKVWFVIYDGKCHFCNEPYRKYSNGKLLVEAIQNHVKPSIYALIR